MCSIEEQEEIVRTYRRTVIAIDELRDRLGGVAKLVERHERATLAEALSGGIVA